MNSAFHGLLVIDKPPGITSRDAVNCVQRWFPPRTPVGHTGTLDPLATGVLVICVGTATRLTEFVQRMEKVYEVDIQLGARSDTDDAEGNIEQQPGVVTTPPDRATVGSCLQEFIGQIEQVPPRFSAARVKGRRAYDLARRGRKVELKPRTVRIYCIEILAYGYPRLTLRVRCGKGTYIRSLARDLGERLGCGAYVETLKRTSVGPFHAENAVSLETDALAARASLLPLSEAMAELPWLALSDDCIQRLRQGQEAPYDDPKTGNELLPVDKEVAVFDLSGNLVAIAVIGLGAKLKPTKVLS